MFPLLFITVLMPLPFFGFLHRFELEQALVMLFFHLDFPVQQQRQHTAQRNDRTQNQQFRPFADDNRAQHFAAELEFQRKCNALRQLKPEMLIVLEVADNAFHRRDNQNSDARQLRQHNAQFC